MSLSFAVRKQTAKKLITKTYSAVHVCRLWLTAKTFAVSFMVLCRLPWQTAKDYKVDDKGLCRQPQTANMDDIVSSGNELLCRLFSHSGRPRDLPSAFLGQQTAKKVDGKG